MPTCMKSSKFIRQLNGLPQFPNLVTQPSNRVAHIPRVIMKHVVHNWVNLNTINSKMGQTNLDLLNSNESIFFRSMRPKILRLPPKAYNDWMMRKGHSETWEVTSLGRACMMVRVVMSSATLVPATSFSLSTLLQQLTTYQGPLLAFTITVSQKGQFPLFYSTYLPLQ